MDKLERDLKKANPSVSRYKWKSDFLYLDVYMPDNIKFRQQFRQALKDFDKVINPYMNRDIELEDLEKYTEKVKLEAFYYDYENNSGILSHEGEDGCEVYISTLGTKNYVRYCNLPCSIDHELRYQFESGQSLNFSHYLFEGSEYIRVTYLNEEIRPIKDIRYNLTCGIKHPYHQDSSLITLEDYSFLYDELLHNTRLAYSVTIANMAKEEKVKKITQA